MKRVMVRVYTGAGKDEPLYVENKILKMASEFVGHVDVEVQHEWKIVLTMDCSLAWELMPLMAWLAFIGLQPETLVVDELDLAKSWGDEAIEDIDIDFDAVYKPLAADGLYYDDSPKYEFGDPNSDRNA